MFKGLDYEQICIVMKSPTVVAEYVWLDADGDLRSKTRIVYVPYGSSKFPMWSYDGSSTGQATGEDSEIILCPIAQYKCPFNRAPNTIIVLCESYTNSSKPATGNNRAASFDIINKYADKQPLFGLEQEYYIINKDGKAVGMEDAVDDRRYYCSVGSGKAFLRELPSRHLEHCDYAGISVTGMNAETSPGQWEFQVAANGIKAADDLIVARYILLRLSEHYGVDISFHPKPFPEWSGSGCHVNFSTQEMREEGGLVIIEQAINKLEKKHGQHMQVYGKDNDLRMTGECESSSYDKFTWGYGNRSASVRVGNETKMNGRGYFEDRRPAANIDPYVVTSTILQTVCE